jgi:hypothetical protein
VTWLNLSPADLVAIKRASRLLTRLPATRGAVGALAHIAGRADAARKMANDDLGVAVAAVKRAETLIWNTREKGASLDLIVPPPLRIEGGNIWVGVWLQVAEDTADPMGANK